MQFTMKNVFALAAIVGTVIASPAQAPSTNIRARDIINKLSAFIDAGINIPPDYKPFEGHGTGLGPEGEIKIVTSEEEAMAFSEHHNHQIRIDAFQGELIYVLASDDAPLEHVGTLRGPYLDQTLEKIEHHLQQQELKALTGTSPAPAADAELQNKAGEVGCKQTWCAITWHCVYFDRNCHGCVVFWCT